MKTRNRVRKRIIAADSTKKPAGLAGSDLRQKIEGASVVVMDRNTRQSHRRSSLMALNVHYFFARICQYERVLRWRGWSAGCGISAITADFNESISISSRHA